MTGQLFAHYFLTDAGAKERAAAERNSRATTAPVVR